MGDSSVGYDGEEDTLNRMGRIYNKILNFSIVTRYFVYVSPLALCIAVPIIVGATAAPNAKIGGVPIVWFFTWIEVGEFLCNPLLVRVLTLISVVESVGLQNRLSLPSIHLPVCRWCRQLRHS